MSGQFVPIGQAAALVGYCVATLRRWDKAGLLPNTMRGPGGRRLILLDDLRKAISGGKS